MSATAIQNRIAPMYYDTPPRTLPPLPKTMAERREALADAVFASVLALQGLLTEKDPKVVIQAAGMILDLDKTQMRHSSYISGTNPVKPLDPIDSDWGSPPVRKPEPAPAPKAEPARDQSDPFVQYVLRVQKRLQAELDAEGHGELIHWPEAEQVAREEIQAERIRRNKLRDQAKAEPPPPNNGRHDVPWQSVPNPKTPTPPSPAGSRCG